MGRSIKLTKKVSRQKKKASSIPTEIHISIIFSAESFFFESSAQLNVRIIFRTQCKDNRRNYKHELSVKQDVE